MGLTFTLADQVFDGSVDAQGCRWYATVEGWDGPALSQSLTARPGDHGSFRGPSYYNTRALVLTGMVLAPDVTALRWARDRLDDLAPIGVDVPLTSVEQRTAIVQLSGRLLKTAPNGQTLNFQIPLEAADPWKYGPDQSVDIPMVGASAGVPSQWLFPLALYTAGGVTIYNEGTQQARPTVTYWGPCTGPWSTNNDTGETVAYDITLPTAADFLVVDHDLGSALLGGTASRRNTQVPTSQLWLLPGRSASTISTGAASFSAGAHITVGWSPTYL